MAYEAATAAAATEMAEAQPKLPKPTNTPSNRVSFNFKLWPRAAVSRHGARHRERSPALYGVLRNEGHVRQARQQVQDASIQAFKAATPQGFRDLAANEARRSIMTKLDQGGRDKMPARTFAFPRQRKEPLEDAGHVRNAVARFNQVEGVSDVERDEAWARIQAAAASFGVVIHEGGWRELTKPPAG